MLGFAIFMYALIGVGAAFQSWIGLNGASLGPKIAMTAVALLLWPLIVGAILVGED